MTLKTLEKANEIREEFSALIDLEQLFRNASMEDAMLRAYRDNKVLNECALWPELTDKLISVLHDE